MTERPDEGGGPRSEVVREEVRADILRWLEETAEHPMPPPPAEWTLAHWHHLVSEHPGQRCWAAYWPGTPEEIVRRLAADGDWRVRHRIAEKRNLPPDLFPVFAADPDPGLRQVVACNQKAPLELVEQLTRDPDEGVARVAVHNLETRRAEIERKRANRERAARQPKKPTGTEAVEAFLAALDHPLKAEILAVREIVLAADPAVTEHIKWNAPSFRTADDFATFHLRPRDAVQLILHPGAKPKEPELPRIAIDDSGSLLQWRAKDRAIVRFRDLEDVEAKRPAFTAILRQWIGQLG